MNQKDAEQIISGVWTGTIRFEDERVPRACEMTGIPKETLVNLHTEVKKVEKGHCRAEIFTPTGCRR